MPEPTQIKLSSLTRNEAMKLVNLYQNVYIETIKYSHQLTMLVENRLSQLIGSVEEMRSKNNQSGVAYYENEYQNIRRAYEEAESSLMGAVKRNIDTINCRSLIISTDSKYILGASTDPAQREADKDDQSKALSGLSETLEEIKAKVDSAFASKGGKSSDDDPFTSIIELKRDKLSEKVAKLSDSIPKFGQDKVDVNEWLFQIESNMELNNIPKNARLLAALPFVKKTAYHTLKKHIQRYSDWAEFRDDMIKMFAPVDADRLNRAKLITLRQGDSFEKFSTEFQYLVALLPEMKDSEKLTYFYQGLRSRTRIELELKGITTFDEALQLATRLEMVRESDHERVNYSRTFSKNGNKFGNKKGVETSTRKQVVCNHCNRVGHLKQDCFLLKKSHKRSNSMQKTKETSAKSDVKSDNSNDGVKCYKCGQIGHISKFCRVPKNKKQVGINTAVVEKNSAEIDEFHNYENEVNVNIVDIHASSADGRLMTVKGVVNGINMVVGIDTGATVSIMNKQVAQRYGFDVIESEKVMKTADNLSRKVSGEIKNLTIEIENIVCTLNVVVIDHRDHDMLLGLDWFLATGVGVIPAENKLIWPQRNEKDQKDEEVVSEEYFDAESVEDNFSVFASQFSFHDDNEMMSEVDWDHDRNKKFRSASALTVAENEQFEDLLDEWHDAFAYSIQDLEESPLMTHDIVLEDEKPVYVPPYRHPEADRLEIKRQVDEMLKAGIIQKSNSDWSSPVILVPKPNGTKRLCVDYKKLNKKTIKKRWPMPNVWDIITRLVGAVFITLFDLKSGYWQFGVSRRSRKYTAFTTPDGQYEGCRVLFGLCNAPSDCCKAMHDLFKSNPPWRNKGCKEKLLFNVVNFLEVYLDDLIIFSKSFQEHLQHVRFVFSRLREAKLKLNPEKCVFFAKRIKILGHIIENGNVYVDPAKVSPLANRLPPKNVREVQMFLGLANYYRQFIRNFASLVAPLTELLKKEVKFEMDSRRLDAFGKIVKTLCSEPFLTLPNLQRPFILYCDASNYCMGAILAQIDENLRERVCGYWSRMFKNAEVHYSITEKECLAVVYSIKHYHVYLYGQKFEVITDHSALKWLLNIEKAVGRLARWKIFLSIYDFDIIYRPGKKHSNVDAISRPGTKIETDNKTESLFVVQEVLRNQDIFLDDHLFLFVTTGKHRSGASRSQIKRVLQLAKYYKYENNTILVDRKLNNKWLIVPPIKDRRNIVEKAHLLGHFQIGSTYNRIIEKFYWYKMMNDVVTVVKQCEACQRNEKSKVWNHQAKAIEVYSAFDIVGIDYVFGLPRTSEDYVGIIVFVDVCTNWAYAKPIKSKTQEETLKYFWEFCCLFGPPKSILTDQGKEFNNELMKGVMSIIGAEHKITAAYNPRTNGNTEKLNQTLMNSLRKHCENNEDNWHKWIPYIIYSYNSRLNSSTGFSPFELVMGKKMNSFDLPLDAVDPEQVARLVNRQTELKKLRDEIIPSAIEKLSDSKETQKQNQNKNANEQVAPLKKGTAVMLKCEGILKKLDSRFEGPYKILKQVENDNYVLEDSTGGVKEGVYPLQKLKVVNQPVDTRKSFEVEKIIDDKNENNEKFFLVKWKASEDTSWVNERDFNSKKLINQYLRQKRFDEQHPKAKPTVSRPRRIRSELTPLSILLFVAFFLNVVGCEKINLYAVLPYCAANAQSKQLNLEKMCSYAPKMMGTNAVERPIKEYLSSNKFDDNKYRVGILSKVLHPIMGDGFECQMIRTTWSFTTTFMGDKLPGLPFDEIINLSPEQCWEMHSTFSCKHNNEIMNMSCSSDRECWFAGPPKPLYIWFSTQTTYSYKCSIRRRKIVADHPESLVYNTNCQINKYYCIVHDTTMVWKRKIVHSCPYEVLGYAHVQLFDNRMVDISQNLAFMFNSFEIVCNRKVIKTTEGLFLSNDIIFTDGLKLDWENNSLLSDYKVKVELADLDFTSFVGDVLFQDILQRSCLNFLASLKILSYLENVHVSLRDYSNNNIVLHARNGHLFHSYCITIKTNISIDWKTNNCYEDLPIHFTSDKKTQYKFLNNHGIIVDSSKITDCKNVHEMNQINDKFAIARLGNKNELVTVTGSTFETLNYFSTKSYNRGIHSDLLLESTDYVKNILEYSTVKEDSGLWLVYDEKGKSDTGLQKIDTFAKLGMASVVNWFREGWHSFLQIIALIVFFISLLILIVFLVVSFRIFCAKKKICSCSKTFCFEKKENPTKTETTQNALSESKSRSHSHENLELNILSSMTSSEPRIVKEIRCG